jgi:hypothetical protein
MSDDRTIADEDRTDDNDQTAAGYTRRLGRIENIISKANNRLQKIIDHVDAIPPPDDQKPTILIAVAAVRMVAQTTVTLATQLEEKLRTV